jgi:hypothetical protein
LNADLDPADRRIVLQPLLHFRAFQGEHEPDVLSDFAVYLDGDADAQNIADYRRGMAAVALAAGDLDTAFLESLASAAASEVNGPAPYAVAGRAATWAGDRARIEDALTRHRASPPHGPALELERRAMEAALLALDGRRSEAVAAYRGILDGWRDLGCQFDFALTAIDAALLHADDAVLTAYIADARRILVALGARPFVERLDAVLAAGGGPAAAPATTSGPVASTPRS